MKTLRAPSPCRSLGGDPPLRLAALPCGQLALALTIGFAVAASLIVRHATAAGYEPRPAGIQQSLRPRLSNHAVK